MALLRVDFFSTALMRSVTINAVIPADRVLRDGNPVGYKKYKTLYLLHGILGNYTDWVCGTRIERWAQEQNLAVIMPSGENRFYLDYPETGENYGEFVGKELVEFTRKIFPLSEKREDTFIAGLSMGGYGALRNGLKYADTFGCVAALSSGLLYDQIQNSDDENPTFFRRRSFYKAIFGDLSKLEGSDKDVYALAKKLVEEGRQTPQIYMCCGDKDSLKTANVKFADYLKDLGINCVYEEGPGDHEWDFWDRYILKILKWLPLEEEEKGISSGNVPLEKEERN